MKLKKDFWLGHINIFAEHEKHEGALREPHRRQVLAGFKSRKFTVRQQLDIRKRSRHFRPFHTPHLDRKVRRLYPRGNVFYKVALLSCPTNKTKNGSNNG